jgi:predicted nucleic acid-binding protein
LRVPHLEDPLDKQIAATALIYGLTVDTRNTAHYRQTGVTALNPFT